MIKTIAIAGLVAIGSVSVADAMPVSTPSYATTTPGIEKTVVIVKRVVRRRPVVVRRRPAARIIVR